jgi:hypothetical protein
MSLLHGASAMNICLLLVLFFAVLAQCVEHRITAACDLTVIAPLVKAGDKVIIVFPLIR